MRRDDRLLVAPIDERGAAAPAPLIDLKAPSWRNPSEMLTWDATVVQEFDRLMANMKPANQTDIIGFLHAVSQTFAGQSKVAKREIILFTDGIHETSRLSFRQTVLADLPIDEFELERRMETAPDLRDTNIWVVTGSSMKGHQPENILRVRAVWTRFFKACNATLKSYAPILAAFDAPEAN